MSDESENLSAVSGKGERSNVKVVVRIRPPNAREMLSGNLNVIKITDKYMLTFDPKVDANTYRSILGKRSRDLQFIFDRVFDQQSTNIELFESTTKPVIESLLQGFNCSVFAYGATAAGKTHTMLGTNNNPGVILLTMIELYSKIRERSSHYNIDVSVSYLEIYNENCKDLLVPKGPLAVLHDPENEKSVFVSNLSWHKPRTVEELLEMLHQGNKNRTLHPTDANKESSRSHAIFQVFVRQHPKASGLQADIKTAKMSLIDLAGSEKAQQTKNRGDRFREGANINKSLLSLGNCINAIVENQSYVPYRDSKLTRLLKDSLSGNCKTIMIATVSPSSLSYEDTYNTLKYAIRAKSMKSTVAANTVHVDYHVSQYGLIVDDMKAQIAQLQETISELRESGSSVPTAENNTHVLKRYEHQIREVFKEKRLFWRQLIECQAMEKEQKINLVLLEKNFEIVKQLCKTLGENVVEQMRLKLEGKRLQYSLKDSQLEEKAIVLKGSLNQTNNRLLAVQNEAEEWANKTDSSVRCTLNLIYENCTQELETVCTQARYKYLKKCLRLHEADRKYTESLITMLLKNQECPLAENTSFEQAQSTIIPKQISWADESTVSELHDVNSIIVSPTPSHTPSRKPSVLRQLVLESRPPTNLSQKSLTERNTRLNHGPNKPWVVQKTPWLNGKGSSVVKEQKFAVGNAEKDFFLTPVKNLLSAKKKYPLPIRVLPKSSTDQTILCTTPLKKNVGGNLSNIAEEAVLSAKKNYPPPIRVLPKSSTDQTILCTTPLKRNVGGNFSHIAEEAVLSAKKNYPPPIRVLPKSSTDQTILCTTPLKRNVSGNLPHIAEEAVLSAKKNYPPPIRVIPKSGNYIEQRSKYLKPSKGNFHVHKRKKVSALPLRALNSLRKENIYESKTSTPKLRLKNRISQNKTNPKRGFRF